MSERTALRWGLLLAAAWAAVALCVVHPQVVGLYHDDGIYLATAKSLAEGHGYRLINLPGAPAQTKYPPLYPLALSLVWRAAPDFPANVIWFKALGILCTAAGLAWFQRVAVRSLGLAPAASLAALAVAVVSPRLLAAGNWVLAEPLFGAVSAVALLSAPRPGGERGLAGRAAFAGALAGAAALVRLQGVALVAALPLALLLERRRRAALVALATGALPLAAWAVWSRAQPAPSSPLLGYYTSYASTLVPSDYGAGWRSIAGVVLARLGELPATLGGLLVGEAPGRAAAGALLLAGLVAGAAVAIARGRWLVPLAAASALGLTLVVPWRSGRFLLPWLPLCLAVAALAVDAAPRVVRRCGAALALALALVAAVRCGFGLLALDRASVPDADALASGRADWPGWVETARWLQAQTPPGANLASGSDAFYFLWSGRPGVRFAPFHPLARAGSGSLPAEPRRVLGTLRDLGGGWLVLDPGGVDLDRAGPEALALGRAIVALPEARARLVFRSADRAHEVWELDAATAAAPPH